MIKKNKLYIAIFSILLLVFLKASPLFDHVESGIYLAYTESLIEDGDFNTINQQVALGDVGPIDYTTYKNGEKGVLTSTYNSPTMWSHGNSILLTPFYIYGKALNYFLSIPKVMHFELIHLSLVLGNIFLCFLGVIISMKVTKYIVREKSILLTKTDYLNSSCIFFATPLFFYTIYEPGNANITGLFIAPLIIYLSYYFTKNKINIQQGFLLGLLCGMAWVIKMDLLFHTAIVGAILLDSIINKNKDKLIPFFFSIIGFLIPVTLSAYNEYLKYGIINYGYIGIGNDNYNVFWDALFSPYRGHIYFSPIYIVAFLGGLLAALRYYKTREFKYLLISLLTIIPIFKEYIATATYVHGSGNFGARQYCVEFTIVLILTTIFLQEIKTKRMIRYIPIGLCLIWTSLMFYFYYRPSVLDIDHVSFSVSTLDYLNLLIKDSRLIPDFIINTAFNFPNSLMKLLYFTIPIGLMTFLLEKVLKKDLNLKVIKITTLALFLTYTGATLSNSYFNPINAKAIMQTPYTDSMIIGNGVELFLYEENVLSMEERMIQVKESNPEQYKLLLDLRIKYHQKAASQIISRPKEAINLRDYFPFPEQGYDEFVLDELKKNPIPKYNSIVD